jgi:hypothetical protein
MTVTVGGVVCARQNISATAVEKCSWGWDLAVSYSVENFPFQFRTTGETARIYTSRATKSYKASDETDDAPDFAGGIGFNGEGFDGVDIEVPCLAWDETYTIPKSSISTAYMATLSEYTGTCNDRPYRGFPMGTVKFLGASGGHQKNETDSEITYSFSAKPNAKNLRIGNITIKEKMGWEYVWTLSKQKLLKGRKIAQPYVAYVETLFPLVSWADLKTE